MKKSLLEYLTSKVDWCGNVSGIICQTCLYRERDNKLESCIDILPTRVIKFNWYK